MDPQTFLAAIAQRLGSDAEPSPDVVIPSSPAAGAPLADLASLFMARAAEVGATVSRAATRAAAFEAIAGLLEERGDVAVSCPSALRRPGLSEQWTADPREASFGLSEADWGIAETGSVVLRHRGANGRSHSLVPPAAGILLPASRLVPDLASALRLIDQEPPPACITFISGVSHSADIAGVTCYGVHGPAAVSLWLIDDE